MTPRGNCGSWILHNLQRPPLSDHEFKTLATWTPQSDAVVAYDYDNVYWIKLNGSTSKVLPGVVLYGKELEWMSSNQIRIRPHDSELLLVSAYYQESPQGAPQDEMGLTPTIMLFDMKSGKRTPVLAKSNCGMDAHWSPDGLWLYFSRGEGRRRSGIWRVHYRWLRTGTLCVLYTTGRRGVKCAGIL